MSRLRLRFLFDPSRQDATTPLQGSERLADVRVICAIGRSGQLGLGGGMPWEGRPERAFVEDVERFFEITRGHVLIAGPKTVASFPDFAHDERTIVAIRSHEVPEEVLSRFAGRVVYIGGGPSVWTIGTSALHGLVQVVGSSTVNS